jgi:hypothetical protein
MQLDWRYRNGELDIKLQNQEARGVVLREQYNLIEHTLNTTITDSFTNHNLF